MSKTVGCTLDSATNDELKNVSIARRYQEALLEQ